MLSVKSKYNKVRLLLILLCVILFIGQYFAMKYIVPSYLSSIENPMSLTEKDKSLISKTEYFILVPCLYYIILSFISISKIYIWYGRKQKKYIKSWIFIFILSLTGFIYSLASWGELIFWFE